jgi:hypothetical protein
MAALAGLPEGPLVRIAMTPGAGITVFHCVARKGVRPVRAQMAFRAS